jgi:hypothetical protein
MRRQGGKIRSKSDGVALFGMRAGCARALFFCADTSGIGNLLAIKFRVRFWIEAPCRLRAAEPPRPRRRSWAGKSEFGSQNRSDKVRFLRRLGQNR